MAVEKIRFIFHFFWILVVLFAFLFPAHLQHAGYGLYELGDAVAGIRSLKNISLFPAALVATGVIVILSAAVLATITSFSSVIDQMATALFDLRGSFGTFLSGLTGLVLPLTFFLS